MSQVGRRSFLSRGSTALAGGVVLGGSFHSLVAGASPARSAQDLGTSEHHPLHPAPDNGGYGPLSPRRDQSTGEVMLALPAGFEYWSFGLTGEPGSDGFPTPDRHDGMAAFAGPRAHTVRLVRNHERGYSPVPFEGSGDEPLVGNPDNAYDRNSGGACTTLLFDTQQMRLLDSFISINGTSVNCAGGPTPWGSWLTCEETTNGPESQFRAPGAPDSDPFDSTIVYEKRHGYVFEVPAEGGPVTSPQPLTRLGRFAHEAVAVDPGNGLVYETEDTGRAGFYRFVPLEPGNLAAGGQLQMLRVMDRPYYDTRTGQTVGRRLAVDWVDIGDPDPASATLNPSAVFEQGHAAGGATFARLEGCWYADGSIWFNSTSGGDAGLGQVWEYRHRGQTTGQLTLVYESTDAARLEAPDNITVSPRGGLLLCEDGSDEQYLRGVDFEGRIFDFALNLISENQDKEFAGATYSPDGSVLFVNIQTPGVSFAIRGPWERGTL